MHYIKSWLIGALLLVSSTGIAHAVMISGIMGITGAYSANSSLDAASVITLDTADVSGIGDFDALLNTPATIIDSIDIGSFSSISLLTVDGWQLDLDSLTISRQTPSSLMMSGTGVLSGNGAYATPADWNFSANATGSTYSLIVASAPERVQLSVPEPGPLALLGIGIFLIGFVSRKRKAD